MKTHLPNKLWWNNYRIYVVAVYTDSVFPAFPITSSNTAHSNNNNRYMRIDKESKTISLTSFMTKIITNPNSYINWPSCTLLGATPCFGSILLSLHFVTATFRSLMPPCTTKTSGVYPLQPVDGNALNSLFLFCFLANFQKIHFKS